MHFSERHTENDEPTLSSKTEETNIGPGAATFDTDTHPLVYTYIHDTIQKPLMVRQDHDSSIVTCAITRWQYK